MQKYVKIRTVLAKTYQNMQEICKKYAKICNKICKNMQKYANNMQKYAIKYAEICKNKDSFSKNMQKYAKNMQKICNKICRNMQKYANKICKNMQNICKNIRVYVFAYGAYICTISKLPTAYGCVLMRMEKGICVSCVLTFWAIAYCELRIWIAYTCVLLRIDLRIAYCVSLRIDCVLIAYWLRIMRIDCVNHLRISCVSVRIYHLRKYAY